MNLQALAKPLGRRWGKIGLFSSGLALLAGSWYALFVRLLMITETWLTPWESETAGPSSASWARAAHDFLETDFGALLPGIGFVLISLGLFIYRLLQAKDNRAVLPWLFAGANIVFLVFLVALDHFDRELASLWLPQAGIEAGYRYIWPLMVMVVVLLIDLFVIQVKLKVESGQMVINRQQGLLVLLSLEGLAVGGWLMWFWVIRDGLAWLDRLFYPYTAIVMIGIPILVLMMMVVGSWLMSRPYPIVGEDQESC
jgi:hypothetical protein